jgi:flagellar basal-body rod protein FlgB
VNELTDAAVVAALRRTMTVAAAKQVVAASNLANVNTPGYKAQETTFAAALDSKMSLSVAATDAGHLGGDRTASSLSTTRDADAPARRDGNTVQLDRELLAMSRAGGEFARAQTALAAKFRLVRYAISETK